MTASPVQTSVTSLRAPQQRSRHRLGPVTGYMLVILLSSAFWALLLAIIF